MQDNKAEWARTTVNYLQIHEPELWNRLRNQTSIINDPDLERCLALNYIQLFPGISSADLNILAGDVESAARSEMYLRGEDELSCLIVKLTRNIKLQHRDLWDALILRDVKRGDELSPEHESLFQECISGVSSSFRISKIIFGIRTIIHAIGLGLFDTQRI